MKLGHVVTNCSAPLSDDHGNALRIKVNVSPLSRVPAVTWGSAASGW
jgi:hypothetical protein